MKPVMVSDGHMTKITAKKLSEGAARKYNLPFGHIIISIYDPPDDGITWGLKTGDLDKAERTPMFASGFLKKGAAAELMDILIVVRELEHKL